jgi:hypothetical protein
VDSVDRRLDLVRAGLVAPEALPDDGLAFGNEASIPAAAVLIRQQYEVAVRGRARGPARLDEQHERKQAHDLRFEVADQHGHGATVAAIRPSPVAGPEPGRGPEPRRGGG